MSISIDLLKKLRLENQAGVADCRRALEEANNDMEKAKKLLLQWGVETAKKKEGKETNEGVIEAYIHATGKVGVLIELLCETDFVARNSEFKTLAHELAMQIAAMNPKTVKELLQSAYIRDAGLTVETRIKKTIAKIGENITVSRFSRFELGNNASFS